MKYNGHFIVKKCKKKKPAEKLEGEVDFVHRRGVGRGRRGSAGPAGWAGLMQRINPTGLANQTQKIVDQDCLECKIFCIRESSIPNLLHSRPFVLRDLGIV